MPSPEYTVASADQTLSGGASIVMRSGAATVVLYVRSSTRIARSVGSGRYDMRDIGLVQGLRAGDDIAEQILVAAAVFASTA